MLYEVITKYPSIKAIHIIQNNELILNESKEGSEHNQLYPIGCVFKSFLSVLIGSAIKERRINSIEDCILDYVDHKEIIDSNWYKIKIKHRITSYNVCYTKLLREILQPSVLVCYPSRR